MFCCGKRCGPRLGIVKFYIESKPQCPYCGGKVIEDKAGPKIDWSKDKPKILFHDRWPKRNHIMDVGIDRIPCPTRQSYLDACKKARVMRPGKGGWEYTEIIPAGVLDV